MQNLRRKCPAGQARFLEETLATFPERFRVPGQESKLTVGDRRYVRDATGTWLRQLAEPKDRRDTVVILFGDPFYPSSLVSARFRLKGPMGLSSEVKGAMTKALARYGVTGLWKHGSGLRIDRAGEADFGKTIPKCPRWLWNGKQFTKMREPVLRIKSKTTCEK